MTQPLQVFLIVLKITNNNKSIMGNIKKEAERCSKERSKRNNCFDGQCEVELNKRLEMRLKMLRTEARANKEALLNKKRCKRISKEKNYKNRALRNLYRGVNETRNHKVINAVYYKDDRGDLVGGEREVLNLWRSYARITERSNRQNQWYK